MTIKCPHCGQSISLTNAGDDLSSKEEQEPFKMVYITTEALHVRKEPNANCPIIGLLTREDQVLPIAEKDGWLKIFYEDEFGWISGIHVRELDSTIPIEKIGFVIGKPYNAEAEETKRLREIINDEFGGSRCKWDLQCTEYVHYRVKVGGYDIKWPVKHGRNGGEWPRIFQNSSYKISTVPKVGSAMSFTKIKPYGHVAFVEEVNPDGSIKISEANWPRDGIYQERKISKTQQAQYGAQFIEFV